MINIKIAIKNDNIVSFNVFGHANFAPKGKDIVVQYLVLHKQHY